MIRSLRGRLVVRTVVATSILFGAAGLLLYVLVRVALIRGFDEALETQARALAALVESDAQGIHVEIPSGQLPEFRVRDHPDNFYQATADVGTIRGPAVSRSPSLGGRSLATVGNGAINRPAFGFIVLPDGRSGRAASYTFIPRMDRMDAMRGLVPRRVVTMTVARDAGEIQRPLAPLRWLLIAVFGGATITSALVMNWVVGRGLRPLDELAHRLSEMGEHQLSQRLAAATAPRELLPVVHRLNELLDRLASAMLRERAFTADVAHELRTPLAGLASALEVCQSRRREPAAYEQVVGDCLGVVSGMEAMVNNLLLLARADARQLPVERQRIDLEDFLSDLWADYAAAAQRRGLTMDWDVPPLTVVTDREKLRVIVRNLFDNAVSYADEGGHLRVSSRLCAAGGQIIGDAAEEDRTAVEIEVSNSGSALAPEQAEHVFDRFWRGDSSRGRGGNHCGLGLSLCRKMADLLGGRLTATSQLHGNFSVTLRMNDAEAAVAVERVEV